MCMHNYSTRDNRYANVLLNPWGQPVTARLMRPEQVDDKRIQDRIEEIACLSPAAVISRRRANTDLRSELRACQPPEAATRKQ